MSEEDNDQLITSLDSISSRLDGRQSSIVDLDQILISQTVYAHWHKVCQQAIGNLRGQINPQDVGDEMAEIQPDGGLVIFACCRDKRIAELKVDAKEWTWRFPKN
jgi:hypothetical protein